MQHKSFNIKNYPLLISIFFHCVITVTLLKFMAENPIHTPFVDDWFLIPWGSKEATYDWAHFWQLLNGHQHNLMKAYTYLLGIYLDLNLFSSAVIGTVIGSLGYFLLSYSQISKLKLTSLQFIMTMLGLSLASLTNRQLQNYFMIICFPWMMAILFIGLYFFLKSKTEITREKKILLYPLLLLSPMTNALGLIVPLSQIIESGFKIFFKRTESIKNNAFHFGFSVFSIFLSFIYPVISSTVERPHNYTNGTDSLKSFFEQPFESIQFLLVAIGQPFVLWLSTAVPEGTIVGIIILLVLIAAFFTKDRKNIFSSMITNEYSIIAGAIFLGIFFLARFKGLGPAGATEPRYTTASLVFLIGVLALFIRYFCYKNLGALIVLSCGIFIYAKGDPIGKGYYSTRLQQSKEILECFSKDPNLPIDMSNPCVKLAYPGEWLDKNEYLQWIQSLKRNNQSFFHQIQKQ